MSYGFLYKIKLKLIIIIIIILSKTQPTLCKKFIKKLRNTEAELKKSVAYKK